MNQPKFVNGDFVEIKTSGVLGSVFSVGRDHSDRIWYGVQVDDPSGGYFSGDFFEEELNPAFVPDQLHLDQDSTLLNARKREGLCPECGEKGHFSDFKMCCSIHGPY